MKENGGIVCREIKMNTGKKRVERKWERREIKIGNQEKKIDIQMRLIQFS